MMKKRFLALLCLSLLSLPLFAQMSKAEMQKMYIRYMRDKGISATIDEDGDIEFTWEGDHFDEMTYYIIIDETDSYFFQITKIGGYSLDNAAERRNAYMAVSAVNRAIAPAKIYVNTAENNMNFSVEAIFVSPEDFAAVFPKLMIELEKAMALFVDEME